MIPEDLLVAAFAFEVDANVVRKPFLSISAQSSSKAFRAETSPVLGPGQDSSSKHHSLTGPNSTQLFFGTRTMP